MTPHNTWSIIISRFLRTRTLFVFITGSKKQADLATAKAFVGSCTDMCPEKERYDREEKRRLHNYEVLQGTEGVGGRGGGGQGYLQSGQVTGWKLEPYNRSFKFYFTVENSLHIKPFKWYLANTLKLIGVSNECLQTGNPQVNHFLAVKEYSRSSADQVSFNFIGS